MPPAQFLDLMILCTCLLTLALAFVHDVDLVAPQAVKLMQQGS
jgi:hypothetical protein